MPRAARGPRRIDSTGIWYAVKVVRGKRYTISLKTKIRSEALRKWPAAQADLETSEQDPEDPSDLKQSEIYQEINNTVGEETADAVHGWMNEHYDEEAVGAYLQLIQDGDQEAIGVFQAAQHAMADPNLAPDGSLEEYTEFERKPLQSWSLVTETQESKSLS